MQYKGEELTKAQSRTASVLTMVEALERLENDCRSFAQSQPRQALALASDMLQLERQQCGSTAAVHQNRDIRRHVFLTISELSQTLQDVRSGAEVAEMHLTHRPTPTPGSQSPSYSRR